MDYAMQQAVCPRCGSSAQVRTVGELFDMLNSMQDDAMQRWQGQQQGPYPGQGPYSGQGPNQGQGPQGQGPQGQGPQGQGPQGQGYAFAGTGYSDYGPYGTNTSRPRYDDSSFDDPGQEIANAVLGAAFKFVGRAIGKKVQKAYEERIAPAMQGRAEQAQQQWQQSRAEQATIVERYPDLRGCLKDQVVFLEGGTKVVPISEIRMPVTTAQADALVDRLRAP